MDTWLYNALTCFLFLTIFGRTFVLCSTDDSSCGRIVMGLTVSLSLSLYAVVKGG